MITKLNNYQILQDCRLFLKNFPTPLTLQLEYFHPVQLPVVITEAKVSLREKQDYSILSLLILRLFDAGITDPEAIRSISGMSLATVLAYIQKEQLILEHIDPTGKKLTQAGKATLNDNENLISGKKPICSQNYDSIQSVHIDPLTASLIPQYLERKGKCYDDIIPNEEAGDFLLPRESAPTDKEFERRLNERLLHDINESREKLVRTDAIKNGNLLNHVQDFKPVRIFYRWGYLAKFEGMRIPMIVFTGKYSVEDLNARSLATGRKNAYVALPVVLSESDSAYLARNGMALPDVWSRSDSCFDYLLELVQNMHLTLPDLGSEEEVSYQPEEDAPLSESEDADSDVSAQTTDDAPDESFENESADNYTDEGKFQDKETFEDGFEDEEDGGNL